VIDRPVYLPFPLRAVRAALRRMNTYLSRRYERSAAAKHAMPLPDGPHADLARAEHALRQLTVSGNAALAYFEKHLPRLARTLTLVPPPKASSRILELGCYMQITPFLERLCGYSEVRGAHYGPVGVSETKTARAGGELFEVTVDLFDAERDRYPYEGGTFETVLACEVIEHLLYDPMHLLLECRRVLEEGGRLILTTPNIGSLTSVAHALHGYGSPQIYSLYSRPQPGAPPDIPHVREYTAFELGDAVRAAGFEVESLFTEPIAGYEMNEPMRNFLEENGYNTSMRGEQTYCVAVKRGTLPINRYPRFLYVE